MVDRGPWAGGDKAALLGLGANVGDPVRQLRAAVQILEERLGPFLAVSSLYQSAPLGYTDQPDFLNLVCAGETQLSPDALLAEIQQIEQALGRVRSFRNAPRTIDIDLLEYGGLVFDTPRLTLPHPRMHQRAFVLAPLAEIAPDWRHPVFSKTAAELLAEAGPLERIERVGSLPGR